MGRGGRQSAEAEPGSSGTKLGRAQDPSWQGLAHSHAVEAVYRKFRSTCFCQACGSARPACKAVSLAVSLTTGATCQAPSPRGSRPPNCSPSSHEEVPHPSPQPRESGWSLPVIWPGYPTLGWPVHVLEAASFWKILHG